MKWKLVLFLFCFYITNDSFSLEHDMSQQLTLSPDVQQLCDDYWNWKLVDRPQFATFVGIHYYDDLLDDISEDGYKKRYDEALQFLDRATILESSLEQEQDIVNIRIMINELTTFKDGYPQQGYFLPVSYFEGPQADYKNLFGWMPKNNMGDYNKILSRLEKLSTQIDQMIHLMRRGLETGKVYHAVSMKTVAESLESFLVADPTESPLYQIIFPEGELPDGMTQAEIQNLQTKAMQLISENVTPAYKRMLDFVVNEYKTRPEIAITSIPDGVAFYNQVIKYHTNTMYTAQEIHDIGLAQVQEIEGQMLQIIQELAPGDMTVPQFSAMIRDDPDNYYMTEEALMDRVNNIVHNLIQPRLDTIFNYIPEARLEVVAKPDPSSPGAFYYAGTFDGSRPGVYRINTYDLKNQPNYTLMTLSLHEGNPGHHLQGSHNMESENIPFFRRASDDRNYNQAPSIFPLNTAFVEGWGLYSESLGFDMELYDDLLERYGHYSYEMFRACRLVVDTGMHALGWSKERAVEFMLKYMADSEASVINEIDRYITWPAQALGYKIGELKIQELRTRAKDQLGDLFDIKGFHDVILDSAGPLDVVESQVDRWIERTLRHRTSDGHDHPSTPPQNSRDLSGSGYSSANTKLLSGITLLCGLFITTFASQL